MGLDVRDVKKNNFVSDLDKADPLPDESNDRYMNQNIVNHQGVVK